MEESTSLRYRSEKTHPCVSRAAAEPTSHVTRPPLPQPSSLLQLQDAHDAKQLGHGSFQVLLTFYLLL